MGIGLGRYISRQILGLHGDQLVAELPPEGGARFVITLPRGARHEGAETGAGLANHTGDAAQ